MSSTAEFEKRIAHVRSHGARKDFLEKRLISYRKMIGHPKVVNSLDGMFYHFCIEALLAWFDKHDASLVRRKAWQASAIKQYALQIGNLTEGSFTAVDDLYRLLTNDSDIIHWTSQYLVSDFFMPWRKDVACHDPQSGFYHSLQVKLALQGDWKHLVARAQYWLDNPPKKYVLYRVDCKFYIALASGDINGMQEALEELVSGKVNRIRGYEDPFAYEQGIISAWGVILSKIAFLHGYNVDIKHPLIPSEWLPVTPLDSYDIELDAFKSIKVFDPLIGKVKWLIEDLEPWSPMPFGEPPLSYIEACDLVGVKPIGG